MNGAREYAGLFKTGQHGRLYLVSSSHARGKTFRIFVLPEGEKAIPNGDSNGPLNSDAVEVFGAVSGNLGWTETYGWIHKGKWTDDFNVMVDISRKEIEESNRNREEKEGDRLKSSKQKIESLLSNY